MPLALAFLSVASLVVTFAQQWFVLSYFGATRTADAFFASTTAPQLVLVVLGSTLGYVLVPLLTDEKSTYRTSVGVTYFWGALVIGCSIAALLFVTAPSWVGILFSGLGSGEALALHLSRIQMVSVALTLPSAVLTSLFAAERRFMRAAIGSLLASAVAVTLMVPLVVAIGVDGAAWAANLRLIAIVGFNITAVSLTIRPRLRGVGLRRAWIRARPLLAASTITKTELVVDRGLAALSPPGGLALYALAMRMAGVTTEILNQALSVPMVPGIAGASKRQDWEAVRRMYRKRLLIAAVYGLIVIAGVALVLPLLRFLGAILPGSLSANSLRRLWNLLLGLSGVIVGGGLGQILPSVFYAIGNTKIPAAIGVIGYAAGVALKFSGVAAFGLGGLTVATSIYYLAVASATYILLERTITREAQNARGGPTD